ncbi:MFS transporter [Veillonella denticariosi JCM 15641]|uniref:Bcr/CflA family efflux transporter n=1 Tax=Veillonella denticariosi JCM 15641 TaxID=1298594 RepID=A0A2S7ZA69_9FIRM|nr:multidrug effflux MFS transporter [Veillonella denticariosi]PQL20153.1 MFS transporter [Veillonella denticariosi JCM 15641]
MTQQTSTKVSFILVVFLGLLTAITPLATDMYLPSLPIMPGELNTSASNIQMTIGIMTFGIALGQLFGGPISDTLGRKTPLIIGNLLCVISSVICAYAPNIEILLLGRFLQGLTGSVGVVIAKAIARDFASGQKLTKLFALLMMVNGLAPVLAPLIGGQLLLFTTWRMIFVILAIFSLILLIGSLLFRESLPKNQRVTGGVSTALANYIKLIKDKAFLGQTLIQFFAFGAFFSYISGSSFVYQNIFHLSAQEFSYLFGINSCGIILASFISSKASNIITARQLLSFSLWQLTIGSALFLATMLLEWPLIPVTIILFFTVCTVSLFGSASFSMAMTKYGKLAGSASAVLGFASMFSAGLVSPLVGIGGEHTGVPMGVTMLVCAALSLLCLYELVEKE